MTDTNSAPASVSRSHSDLVISLGLAAVVCFFMVSGFISYSNTRIIKRDVALVTRTHDVIVALDDLTSLMKDAETGQRGFILTGDPAYLQPYTNALNNIDARISEVETLLQANPAQMERFPVVKAHIRAKLTELAETIALRRTKGIEAAIALIGRDVGKNEMDAMRLQIRAMDQDEQDLRAQRTLEMDAAYRAAIKSGLLTGLLGVILSGAVALLIRRSSFMRRRQEWLQSGQVGLANAMFGEQRLELLGNNVLKFLAEYLGAEAGAFFAQEDGGYTRIATYGVPAGSDVPGRFMPGDGLLGQAVRDIRAFVVNDVPDGYLTLGSALGRGKPRHIVISPSVSDGAVNGVLELGVLHPLDKTALELLQRVSDSIGSSLKAAQYRANLQNFLEETQRQAEELQAQSEELRVANEELEEQSRVLKESQARLEQQQVEMEQTNSQLEEQTRILESQRDDLERAKAAVQSKAQELERASQYKSDFLANMSHELRTPLNSSLILARLLADNPGGNLTDEQVKFAQTIESSGNDLLTLINDILDLSKIEAGHMEVRAEHVPVERLLKDIDRVFKPLADKKSLSFKTEILPGCPAAVDTDRMRLEQILRNLLSNAIKFTDTGEVRLTVGKGADGGLGFSVIDTGIGVSATQQEAIFKAFQQADGTISRKYGGTGLGLSISRELSRLLGGRITLASTPGHGSTFTLILPETYSPAQVTPQAGIIVNQAENAASAAIKSAPPAAPARISKIIDDRESLTGAKRIILIIEDDESFARILYDLAHETGFQCLIAHNAAEGLTLARQYLPSAVMLDVGLPDNSGLSVLDRLKRDTRTRHIPVHVVSASDYAQTAMSMGAVGYMIKPVKREELVSALQGLETRFARRMRRVLIVEDDDVQRESVGRLLGSHDVETVGAATAAECLEKLTDNAFDCMVLDLSLPDASGYSLLETLSREESYSFPPVIVYTGRDMSADEEHRLRKYSKSIIIKGAKSPERLLDEVTLFLHQVVSELPGEQQKMLEKARNRDAVLENRHILIVEDDVANIYALTSILEPRGAIIRIARNGREALQALEKSRAAHDNKIDLVLMDMMMPEMDGLTATREIRKRQEWKKLPVIMLTAKAMRDDQERCLDAGANDYMAKPLDVEKLLSLVRVWMPR